MSRVFLDGSVLFTAALNPGGKAVIVIELGVRGSWWMVTDTLAVAEARHNITLRFPQLLRRFDVLAALIATVPVLSSRSSGALRPSKTRRIFESARIVGASHLLMAGSKMRGVENVSSETAGNPLIQTVDDFFQAKRVVT